MSAPADHKEKESRASAWRRGFKNGFPVFMGYFAVSFTFGIAAQGILKPLQTVFMSASNYTSAGQFAALGLIAAASSLGEMALTQLVVNLRYSLMSAAISQKLDQVTPLRHRFFMAMGLTDEVFALSAAEPGRLEPFYFYGLMSSALPGWVLGTLLGSFSHGVLPPRLMSALGIAIYGMFIAIIFPPAKKDLKLAGIICVSMLCGFLFDKLPLLDQITPGFKIILVTLAVAGGAAVLFPVGKDGQKETGKRKAAACEVTRLEGCEEAAQ